jgi:hypothetical protein
MTPFASWHEPEQRGNEADMKFMEVVRYVTDPYRNR